MDNIALFATEPLLISQGIGEATDFVGRFDMQIDAAKTQAWALEPADRKALRARTHSLLTHGRDLGGHLQVQLDHRCTNEFFSEHEDGLP